MEWIKVSVKTSTEGIEPLCGRLYNIGVTGVEIEDKDDFSEFLQNNHEYWDYVDEGLEHLKTAETTVRFYVSDNAAGHEMLGAARSEVRALKELDADDSFGRLEIFIENVRDEDWADNWKKYFHPLEVGEKILIRPEWEPITHKTDRTVFTVNPGMNFGTGSHQTTRMCIESLEKYVSDGCSVLDLGCGSGILSIIALLLGAKEAVAVDIDPNAIDSAYSNLALNHLPRDRYEVIAGDIISDSALREKLSENKYDIVLANIVADVIIALSPYVKDFMKPEGVFICSGIITERIDEVKAALSAAGLTILNVETQDDWAAIVAR